jgi:hypothetical protein
MTENYLGLRYHAYFDNLFTSTKLMKLFLERKLYTCETVCAGRKDWPKELTKPITTEIDVW